MSQITLFTPGPTHIPAEVLAAMNRGSEHHRTAEFRKIFLDVRESLQECLQSAEPPLLLTCSGTGGMEAVIANGITSTNRLGYLNAGKFGERWGAIAKARNIPCVALEKDWGESATPEEIRSFLQQHSSITHFALQYCETSTTVLHDVPTIVKMISKEFPEIQIIVDAISAATTLPLSLKELPIDALVLASQKAFMLPPGLTMVFLSDRYWNTAESVSPNSLYFDLKKERKTQLKGDGAWTPALILVYGLQASLAVFQNEGWENVFARHNACSEFCRTQFEELGLLPVTHDNPSPSVSGAFVKEDIPIDEIRSTLFKQQGIRIAGGQDHWKGKALRVGHMGVITPEDLGYCFSELRKVMEEGGYL